MIDYEAAWKEIKDKEWEENRESKYRYYRLCTLEAKYTLPPGTPLTPRQAWLAFASGLNVGRNKRDWWSLLPNGKVARFFGDSLAITDSLWEELQRFMNSDQAVIVESDVVVNERDTKLVVDHETANGETQNLDEESVNYRGLYVRFLSWLRDHGHDTAVEVGLSIASWEEIPSDRALEDVEKEQRLTLARQKASQAWCTDKTSHIEMDVDLAEAFAIILEREMYPSSPAAMVGVDDDPRTIFSDDDVKRQEEAAESFKPYQIPKDQLDAFMEGLQKGSDKLYGEKPSVPVETPKCETQALTPRCDGCAWGHEPHEDIWECRWDTYCNSHRADYWCSRFLPADRSQVRCETCWKSKKVSWGSDRICKQEPLSKLLPSLIVDHEDYCGHWAVTPPAWRE
jgi:hypothetical protein